MCRKCNTDRLKRYRKTRNGIISTRKAVRKYEMTHPGKKKSWSKAQCKYPTTKPCEVCGKLPTHRHHPDINKPLEIVFLCPAHHTQVHQKMIQLTV